MGRLYTVLFLLAFTICQSGSAETETYRWVDEDGVVHYSDSPNPASADPESERIEIRTPNVMRSQAPAAIQTGESLSAQAGEETPETEQAAAYRAVRIVSPSAGETLWNIGGRLTVNMQVTPALRSGHGFVVYLDGELFQQTPVPSGSIVIDDVYRGEHTLRVAVRTSTGAELIASEPLTFYVQQATAN